MEHTANQESLKTILLIMSFCINLAVIYTTVVVRFISKDIKVFSNWTKKYEPKIEKIEKFQIELCTEHNLNHKSGVGHGG